MKIRTLLLLGFTAAAAGLSGCIIETTNDGPSRTNCLDNQYFNVHWEVDNGTLASMYSCIQTPVSHVELTTNTGQVLLVGADCDERRTCSNGDPCNWAGSTLGGVAVGTYVVTATLVSDTNRGVLSESPSTTLAIAACQAVDLSFQFGLQ